MIRPPDPGDEILATMLSRPPRPASRVVAGLTLGVLVAGAGAAARSPSVAAAMAATRESVLARGEWWRTFTTLLVHADGQHLLGNALPLTVLSYLVYGYFGALAHPIGSVFGGAAVVAAVLVFYGSGTALVGASGVVYLLAGFWLASYVLVERRHPPARRLVRALGFGLVLLVPASLDRGVSHGSHAVGFLVGAILATANFAARRDAIRAQEARGPAEPTGTERDPVDDGPVN